MALTIDNILQQYPVAHWQGKEIKIVKVAIKDIHYWGLGEDGQIYAMITNDNIGWHLSYGSEHISWCKWVAKEFGDLLVWM